MPKRPRYSRWRRLPGVFRTGEQKPADPDQELERLTLYVPWSALDLADQQSNQHGYPDAQTYCTDLLLQALDAERVREQVAEVEAKHGTLDGLQEIADDPEYLAELSHAIAPAAERGVPRITPPDVPVPDNADPTNEPESPTPWVVTQDSGPPAASTHPSSAAWLPSPRRDALSPSALVVLRHAGQGGDDPYSFLACLRRGEAVPPNEVAELAQALHQLEVEYRGSRAMDRRLTFALHRLAFESQILHTDAWPGAFDAWTVDMLRAVQEAVERILSGEDIRYGATPPPPPETHT